jgi:hypothetical protein
MGYMNLRDLQRSANLIKSKIELKELISHLKILASNRRSDKDVIQLIEKCISIANKIEDWESNVVLNGLLILQYVQQVDMLEKSNKLLDEMQDLARKINYKEGLAFSHSFAWYIAKIQGEKEKSKYEISKALELLDEVNIPDNFIFHFIKYTCAIEMWFETRDIRVAETLENCIDYFYEKNLYHSLTMSLGVLMIIYQHSQNKRESMKLIKRILCKEDVLTRMPKETQSMVYFFIGFTHALSFNLSKAKSNLLEAINILEPIYRKSIYSSYYITALSFLTSTYALQGKLELAIKQMKEVEKLIKEEETTKNLDSFNKKQIRHTFDLTKFYIYSRLQGFRIEKHQDLIQEIYEGIDEYHSNAVFLSEFLINTNLRKEQLLGIKGLNNSSTKRVEHVINLLIDKTTSSNDEHVMKYVLGLRKRPHKDKMTFTEKAFADLLAAQEYYKINRFAEIYPLLRKYENQLHKIEVLEMRVFMEAFIQVGAFKNGDPLGPALQYMAIKKCKQYGFSRLENKLSDYLKMQGNDTIRMMI